MLPNLGKTTHKLKNSQTEKQLMSFLGLCNYCRSWFPDYSIITTPLQKLMLDTPMAMTDKITWTDEEKKAFSDLK